MRLHWSLLSRVGRAGRERRRRERQRKTKPRDYIGSDSVFLKVRADSSLKSRTHQTHDPFLFPTQRHVRSEALPSCFSLPRLRKWRKKKRPVERKEDILQNLTQISIKSLNFAKWVRTDTCSCRLFSQPSLLLLLLLPCTKDVPRESLRPTPSFHS